MIEKKLTCFVYSEGGKDRKFLQVLICELEKFHAKKWFFNYDNASGGSASFILNKCYGAIRRVSYDVVICFVDLDRLKSESKEKKVDWKREKSELEKKYLDLGISIIWWKDNLEEELNKVLGEVKCGKWKINKKAKEEIEKFKNSDIWQNILNILREKDVR